MDLTTKYRPTNFDEVVGQEAAVSSLRGMLSSGTVHPTILLCGPHGVGKTTLSRLIGLYANCQNPQNGEACRECSSCKTMLGFIAGTGEHPAYIEKNAASDRGIDMIRAMEQEARLRTPFRFRIFSLDEAHAVTPQAFQASLKLFEEPPGVSRFVLSTTNPEKLPKTIRSRCKIFWLQPVPLDLVVQHLAKICQAEELQVPDGALQVMAKTTDGHIRDAIQLLAQVKDAAGTEPITPENLPHIIQEAEAAAPYIAAQKFCEALLAGRYSAALIAINRTTAHEYLVGRAIEIFQQILYRMVSTNSGAIGSPDKAWLVKDIQIPVPADDRQRMGYLDSIGIVLKSLLDAQRNIKDYLTDSTAELTLAALRILQSTRAWPR